jgi:hypothetical protein
MIVMVSCDKEDENHICYSFDIRQCQTDLFKDKISENETQENREILMEEWLEEQGLEIESVLLEINFHMAVCEACDVCPQGDRYFIQIEDETKHSEILDTLRLLNLEKDTLCDKF